MLQATAVLKKVEGLSFTKLLGSGGKQGFGILPNWGLYGLLGVWNNLSSADNFFNNHPLLLDFKAKSISHQHIYLEPLSSHGKWDGQEPFAGSNQKSVGKIAVITRAKIKWKKIWQFWRSTNSASKDMQNRDGLIFSVGIGELPLIQQATFSIWESSEKMKQYAYNSPQHTQVIQKTRELNWYSEALFARFAVLGSEGNIDSFKIQLDLPKL